MKVITVIHLTFKILKFESTAISHLAGYDAEMVQKRTTWFFVMRQLVQGNTNVNLFPNFERQRKFV